jgi:hypothetical protein
MRPHMSAVVAFGGLLALPCLALAQPPAAPSIIACEGPNMPAACPRSSDAPRSLAAERAMVTKRDDVMTLQAQQLMWQRQALVRGVSPGVARPPAPPVYPTVQPNPYMAPIAPPDFKAAAQLLGNVISGGPHN